MIYIVFVNLVNFLLMVSCGKVIFKIVCFHYSEKRWNFGGSFDFFFAAYESWNFLKFKFRYYYFGTYPKNSYRGKFNYYVFFITFFCIENLIFYSINIFALNNLLQNLRLYFGLKLLNCLSVYVFYIFSKEDNFVLISDSGGQYAILIEMGVSVLFKIFFPVFIYTYF